VHSDLGPWANDNFQATVRAAVAGLGANAGMPDTVRFVASVTRLIRLRMVSDVAAADPRLPSIFLLGAPTDGGRPVSREPVINSGQVCIAGKIWFVSEFANSGRSIETNDPSNLGALFAVVTEELELGTVPALLFDPRTSGNQIRYYPKGLAKDDLCDVCDLSGETLTVERILEVIDRVWLASLASPKLTTPFALWTRASKNIPGERAEQKIQGLLRTGLQAGIPSCDPRVEYDLRSGRADIVLEEPDLIEQSTVHYRAILELKVFRSRTHSNEPVGKQVAIDAARDGIEQVASYAKERRAPIAALCCFDMRSTCTGAGAVSPAARLLAANSGVEVAIWFLFSSAAALRRFERSSGSGFRKHY
jgi:hypothetical protein